MDERDALEKLRRAGINLKQGSTSQKGRMLNRALRVLLPPKDISDGTCWKNITKWAVNAVNSDVIGEHELFSRILDYAIEATGPGVRNPAAVFMSIIKKELHYGKVQKRAVSGRYSNIEVPSEEEESMPEWASNTGRCTCSQKSNPTCLNETFG